MQPLNVVWFKRDLRIRDHKPLTQAFEQDGPVLLLHVFEPLDLGHPTTSQRHVQFRWEAWQALRAEVKCLQWPVEVASIQADVLDVFQWLLQEHGGLKVWSHEETGLRHTFDRDIAVKNWCRASGVTWS